MTRFSIRVARGPRCVLAALWLLFSMPAVLHSQSALRLPGISELERKVAALEVNAPDADGKAQLADYRAALAELKAANGESSIAAEMQREASGAEERLRALQLRITALQQPTRAWNPTGDRESQEAQLTRELAELQQKGQEQARLQQQLLLLRVRPEAIAVEQAELQSRLAAQDALGRGGGLPVAANEAQQIRKMAQGELYNRQLERLRVERLTHKSRLQLLDAQANVAGLELKRVKARVERLQTSLNELRGKEAAQAVQQAEQAQRDLEGQNPLLQSMAAENRRLGARLAEVVGALERAQANKALVDERLGRTSRDLARISRQFEVLGVDESLAGLLRLQQQRLPELKALLKRVRPGARQLAELCREQLELRDARQELQQDLSSSDPPVAMEIDQWKQVSSAWRVLAESRLPLLEKLEDAVSNYLRQLEELGLSYQQLQRQVAEDTRLLDRHLVWIPSTEPLTVNAIGVIEKLWAGMRQPSFWMDPEKSGEQSPRLKPFSALAGLLFLLVVLVAARRLSPTLPEMARHVGNVTHDSFRYTFRACVITLLKAAPLPLLMLLSGALASGQGAGLSALGHGLLRASLLLMLLRSVAEVVARGGIGQAHFRWDQSSCDALGRAVHRLYPLVPLVLLLGFLHQLPESAIANGPGRLLFLVSCGWFATVMHGLLSPQTGVMAGRDSWLLRWLVYLAVQSVVISLAALSYAGYHYTALRLELLLFVSVWVGFILLLLRSLAVRWLLVAERRIALAEARARRAALVEARVAREVAAAAGEGVPDTSDGMLQLSHINEQTRRLLRALTWFALILALALVWRQMIPALGRLDEVVLWSFSGDSGGVQVVSLWRGIQALLVLVITLVAGRNFPGLLEIAVLLPLKVDAGNRYAATNLSRYLIYSVGFLVVVGRLGLAWSDVQWLVAAMGVGLGFGLQETFANFISGIMILFEKPLRIGDMVTVGDISGTVSRIRMRATTITDWDNRELVVPNKTFITDPLINWTLTDPVTRMVIKVGIAYGSDTDLAHRVMTQVVRAHPDVLSEPQPTVFFLGFGESSLDFEIRVFVPDRLRRLPVTHDLHMALNRELAAAGVEIPFPQRDLHLRSISPELVPAVGRAGKPKGGKEQ